MQGLTLKSAEETVSRGKRISKNTLIIELATNARHEDLSDHQGRPIKEEDWQDAKAALEFIQKTIELKAEEDSAFSDRIRQRISVNLNLLESYIEDLEK